MHNISSRANPPLKRVLLTGATGYVGGRLLPILVKAGYRVRCLVRRLEKWQSAAGENTEIIQGDLLDPGSLSAALDGIQAAYYLVHSMNAPGDFQDLDRRAAVNFTRAAMTGGLKRIVYLGGLADSRENLSPHLRSRQEVGRILRDSGIPVIEFRASIVIGNGSLSYEMIRALVERLPLMVTPRWVSGVAQPISVRDLLDYLLAALDCPFSDSGVFEIGGADQVSYGDIMRFYGRTRGLKVRMIPVPVLTPYLSSLWLGLVTPLYARIGRKLIESIVHSTVVQSSMAAEIFPVRPVGVQRAIQQALDEEEAEFRRTHWGKVGIRIPGAKDPGFRYRRIRTRRVKVPRTPREAFDPIKKIGGKNGWYTCNRLWRLRGWIDTIIGGVGMRRKQTPSEISRPGDIVDFWRVDQYEPDRLLRLTAETKLPGRAWVEFQVMADNTGSVISQTDVFDPRGFRGRLYWFIFYPIHQWVYFRLLRGIARQTWSQNPKS